MTAATEARLDSVGVPDSLVCHVSRLLAAAGVAIHPGAAHRVLLIDPTHATAVERVAAVAGPGRILVLCPPGSDVAEAGWDLLRAGASDVVAWTGDEVASTVTARLGRWQLVDRLLDRASVRDFLVGGAPAWRAVLREAVEAAFFVTANVLITGESGTGKERMAQLVHDLDPRPGKKRLVILDCSTVVPSLSGSEFFGHEKGAFTGAATARAGAFELADGGTLFLDEVGELPVTLQAELLRVIQEGTYKRVGSSTWRQSEFRLICATNRDLAAGQETGVVRRDFFHRISGCTLHLPPLRERREDVVPLVRHYFRQALDGAEPPELSAPVRELLLCREYPGNVRDLRALALRIISRHLGPGEITVGDVPENARPRPAPAAVPYVVADAG